MSVKIVKTNDMEHRKNIEEALKDNDGYCPCRPLREADTKCMCKEFREQESGPCYCGLYVKETD